jgi:predicted acetyltransferase
MPELSLPAIELHPHWIAMRDDFGRGVHLEGSGLHADDEVDSAAGFSAWVRRLWVQADTSVPPDEGRVHSDYWWITEGETVLGSIALRHELNDFLLDAGGHIGYSVRPSARRRGLASYALGLVLQHARKRGLERVLITCDVDNEASHRTILHHGGVLEDVRDTSIGTVRRLWIGL